MRALKQLASGTLAALFLFPLSMGMAGSAAAQQEGPIEVSVTIPAPGSQSEKFEVTDAEFRWGLNVESTSGAFEPGTCNFLSAGVAGDSGSSRHWGASDSLYAVESGNTRIEKPDATGKWRADSWANRCKDGTGRTVGTSTAETGTGAQVVIEAGSGTINAKQGTAEIGWSGSFTVAMYNGRTYWSASDPVLKVADGKGTLMATVSGFGSDMNDTTKWDPLPATKVTLATLPNVTLGDQGIVTEPAYRQVKAEGVDQVRTGDNWGAFPQDFMAFQSTTGQGAYWYSSGGLRDAAKVAATLYISYTPGASVAPTIPPKVIEENANGPHDDPGTTSGSGGGPGPEPGNINGTGTVLGGGMVPGFVSGDGTVISSEPLPTGTVLAATAAATINATNWLGGTLIPEAIELAKDYRNILLWSIAGLLGLASVAWVGFRRGWLIWPFGRSTKQ